MRLRIEALSGELEEKALSAVRLVASALAKHDARLSIVAKALWKADLAVKHDVEFQGLRIAIENPVGSVRHWKDHRTGREGSTVMKHPYGFVRGTEGADGDGYDCFLGPDPDAPFVWIVHQARPDLGNTQQDASAIYDEDKSLLGFSNVHDATAAFQSHYDDPGFFGSMTQMPIEEFRAKVLRTKDAAQDGMLKGRERRGERRERLVIMSPELRKADSDKTLAQVFTEGTPAGLGNRAVYTGVGGPNIAMGVPPRPEHRVDTSSDPMSATSMRSPLEQTAQARAEDRKAAPRRDPKVYETSTITELPVHPLPEWEQRMVAGAEARKDAPFHMKFVQDKLDRRSWFIREGHPERLLPRDGRIKEKFFIPEKKSETRRQEAALKASAGVQTTGLGSKQAILAELDEEETEKAAVEKAAAEDRSREGDPPMPSDVPYARQPTPSPAKPEYKTHVVRTATVAKAALGPVTLNVLAANEGFLAPRYEVLIKNRPPRTFSSLSSACDHVWVLSKGFQDVAAWQSATGKRKVPSGAGWRFWALSPEGAKT